MGNIDSIPVLSQTKSFGQWLGGDAEGALATQKNFAYNNTFPVVSQIASAGIAIGGDLDKAENLQKRFVDDMEKVINSIPVDSIPVVGHIKGIVHYSMGDNDKGDKSMKEASHNGAVALCGVAGFGAAGPAGAVAGGIGCGAAMDGTITGSEMLIKGKDAKLHGYVAIGHEIVQAVDGKRKITVEQGLDMAKLPLSDGIIGIAAGLGVNPGGNTKQHLPAIVEAFKKGGYRPLPPVPVLTEKGAANALRNMNNVNTVAAASFVKPKPMGLNKHKAGLDNGANKVNPNRDVGDVMQMNNHVKQPTIKPSYTPRPLIRS